MTKEVSVLCLVLIWLTLPAEAAEPYSAINKAPPPAPSKTAEGAKGGAESDFLQWYSH